MVLIFISIYIISLFLILFFFKGAYMKENIIGAHIGDKVKILKTGSESYEK